MKKVLIRRIKKALPRALILGGLLAGLFSIQAAAVTHDTDASAPAAEAALTAAADAENDSSDDKAAKNTSMQASDTESTLAVEAAAKDIDTSASTTESLPEEAGGVFTDTESSLSEESAAADTGTESSLSEENAAEDAVHATREDFTPAGMLQISQSEALEWLHNSVGVSIDFDGAYGAQCVDLLKAYYHFLGVGAQHGNAADYRFNFLPEGWQRLEGVQPEPGDILIYVGGRYGHVAVYESDYSTFHQNWGKSYVINMTDRPYNGISPNRVYWGVVRPFFPEYAGIQADDIIDMTRKLSLIAFRFPGAAPQGHIDYEAPLPSVFETHREAVLHRAEASPS